MDEPTVLGDDLAAEIAALKASDDDHILVAGSGQLVQALLALGLVDELRLMVFPIVLGEGKRLFEPGTSIPGLKLKDARPVGDQGVVVLVYEPAVN